jgi:hypothetical protein
MWNWLNPEEKLSAVLFVPFVISIQRLILPPVVNSLPKWVDLLVGIILWAVSLWLIVIIFRTPFVYISRKLIALYKFFSKS